MSTPVESTKSNSRPNSALRAAVGNQPSTASEARSYKALHDFDADLYAIDPVYS